MKSLISLFALLLVLSASNAQDTTTCQRLIGLKKTQKFKFSRMVTTLSGLSTLGRNTVILNERDSLSNSYISTSTDFRGKKTQIETITFNKKRYRRTNDEAWILVSDSLDTKKSLDSLRTSTNKTRNDPYNCQQLNDDILDGENCSVFTYELESRITLPARETPNASASKEVRSTSIVKEWYTKQGLIKKLESKVKGEYGETVNVTTYEYDIPIPQIKEPQIKQK